METYKLGNYTFEIVDSPQKTLSLDEKEKIIRQCIPVTRMAFRNEGVNESDVIIHAVDVSTVVYLKDAEGDLVGFSSCTIESIMGQTIIHLKGTALSPDHQGEGLYPILTVLRILYEAEKHDPKSLLIGTRTQSPIVYHSVCDKLGLYPRIDEQIPDQLKPIATEYTSLIAEKHSDFHPKNGVIFDTNTFIVRRAYGGYDQNGNEFGFCMYGNNIPWLKDNEKINDFFKENLDFNNGDCFLVLGPYIYEKNFDQLGQSLYHLNPHKLPIIDRFKK